MRIFAKNRFIATFEKTTEVKNLLLTQTVLVGWKLLDYIDIIDIMATLEQFSGKYGILYLLLTFTAIILQVFLFSNITQAKTVTLYLSFDFVYVKSLRLGYAKDLISILVFILWDFYIGYHAFCKSNVFLCQ